jgi:hypothetical protein
MALMGLKMTERERVEIDGDSKEIVGGVSLSRERRHGDLVRRLERFMEVNVYPNEHLMMTSATA